MQAVILAAGRGSRLRPFTDHCSKAMSPILGRPIAYRVMEQMIQCGLTDFIIVTNPADETIGPFFHQVARKENLQIQFIQQHEQLGMGHAILLASPFIKEDFMLSACDNLVKDDVMPAMVNRFDIGDANAVLLLKPVPPEKVSSTAIVAFKGEEIVEVLEKPTLEEAPTDMASLPLYIFKKDYLDYLPLVQPSIRGEYEMQDAMAMMIAEMGGYYGVKTDWRLTLTNVQDLFEINQYYLKKHQPSHIDPTVKVSETAQLIPPYYIDENVEIKEHAIVGPNVYIDKNGKIGAHAAIQNSLLMQGKAIPPSGTLNSKIRY